MNRRLVACLVFTLGLSLEAQAQLPTPRVPPQSPTPAWLPRGAFLGTSLRRGAVVPEARLQWQLPFFHHFEDTLSLLIEPTAAVAASRPATLLSGDGSLAALQFYSLMVGVGYTSQQPTGVQWGFQLGTGPMWYRARFTGSTKAQESYVVGHLDGRARIGYRFGPIGLGVAVGYGDPYNYKRASLARPYIGGLQLGVYADWR
ncbi:hypothetical protein [Melittangium boletus]|uniref:Outer membrane protein beta-barrel domain-containing protein n=1 Tax=Melittangium boletus DSM 14713 TaxID=1294270 RepID=A0A250IT39_9BACT|nr:hypothetical protein [Melittangium boletus]ATB34347.1 hypothetical protein MEBOL_007848 [Melittangium boletus DSM 14713]